MAEEDKPDNQPELPVTDAETWQEWRDSPPMQAGARALREMRKRMRWTQPELANAIHIGLRTLARYENREGPISLASAVRLENLAHACKYTDLGETFSQLIQSFVNNRFFAERVEEVARREPSRAEEEKTEALRALRAVLELWPFYPPRDAVDEQAMRARFDQLFAILKNAFLKETREKKD